MNRKIERVLNQCTDIDDAGKALVRKFVDSSNMLTQDEMNEANEIIVSHDELEASIKEYEDPRRQLLKAGFTFMSASNFIATPTIPPEWIIKDFIATKGDGNRAFKGELIGKSKQRKTFAALQMAICLATGHDFLNFKIGRPWRVLYVNNELPIPFLKERLQRQVKALFGSDTVVDLRNLIISCPLKPYAVRENEQTERTFIKSIKDGKFDFVFFDPVYKMLKPGEDENSGLGMSGILRFRDLIITETNAGVMGVHHDGKSLTDGKEISDRGAGSGHVGRDYDFRLTIDPHSDGNKTHAVLGSDCRVRKAPPEVTIVFDEENLIFSVADDIPACRPSSQSRGHKQAMTYRKTEVATMCKAFESAAIEIANEHGNSLLDTGTFKLELRKKIGAGKNATDEQFKVLIKANILATTSEKIVKADGAVGNRQHGDTFVSTPELIKRYNARFGQS